MVKNASNYKSDIHSDYNAYRQPELATPTGGMNVHTLTRTRTSTTTCPTATHVGAQPREGRSPHWAALKKTHKGPTLSLYIDLSVSYCIFHPSQQIFVYNLPGLLRPHLPPPPPPPHTSTQLVIPPDQNPSCVPIRTHICGHWTGSSFFTGTIIILI